MGCISPKSCACQPLLASFRPCRAANAPSGLPHQRLEESAKSFKCFLLNTLRSQGESTVAGTSRAFESGA